MAHRTTVILVVALSESIIGPHTPRIAEFARSGRIRRLRPRFPAVTCTSQACMLTGEPPATHGIVGNGWYEREIAEIRFWKQPNAIVRAEKVWETARSRDPSITCAKLFWWYNMHSSADVSVTPRPQYKADGRKIPDCYSHPPELRDELQAALGRFPLFKFWGPAASVESSQWIAEATHHVESRGDPTLTLVYLPHLDYALQKFGPETPQAHAAAREIDALVGRMIDRERERGARVMLVSEYGIERVREDGSGPIHINRALREAGLLRVRTENGSELLDPGASPAFAVADHQAAHVYVQQPHDLPRVRDLLSAIEGVEFVLDRDGQRDHGIAHGRSGDLTLSAEPGRWFTYYHWLDDDRAPDFARTVEIPRKPGYDPAELYIDPAFRFPKLAIARRLLMKRLGFRQPMDLVPLDATLVRGTHGRATAPPHIAPLAITEASPTPQPEDVPIESVRDLILESLFADQPA